MTDINPLRLQDAPRRSGARWFVKRGAKTYFNHSFLSREQADNWIKMHVLDWRVGYIFRVRGDSTDTEIVDRNGRRA